MKIDMAALKGLVRERDLSLDLVVQTIESALLTAYRHTEGAQPHARVVLDRKAGDAVVLAQEVGEDGAGHPDPGALPAGDVRVAVAEQGVEPVRESVEPVPEPDGPQRGRDLRPRRVGPREPDVLEQGRREHVRVVVDQAGGASYVVEQQ